MPFHTAILETSNMLRRGGHFLFLEAELVVLSSSTDCSTSISSSWRPLVSLTKVLLTASVAGRPMFQRSGLSGDKKHHHLSL